MREESMARRYLLVDEIASALRRGKAVECFLGPCRAGDDLGIRWLSLREAPGGEVCACVFESRDEGSPDFLDVYEFSPLRVELELGEPEERMMFPNLSECLASISERWPEAPARMVNQDVVQDEYADFIARGRQRQMCIRDRCL